LLPNAQREFEVIIISNPAASFITKKTYHAAKGHIKAPRKRRLPPLQTPLRVLPLG
jgi:hypothetical protein